MSKVKPCPICKIGKPRMIHYASPFIYSPDSWEEVDEGVFDPMVTYKRIECSNCGATSMPWEINCDTAVDDWNYESGNGKRIHIIQYITEEPLEVE